MNQLNFHRNQTYTPPNNLPIIEKLVGAYKLWQEFLPHFPKTSRYTLGSKIDLSFTETIEAIFTASFLNKEQKVPLILKASAKLDALKFFLQIAWRIKSLDNKKYMRISEHLDEIGRMLGGWNRQLTK